MASEIWCCFLCLQWLYSTSDLKHFWKQPLLQRSHSLPHDVVQIVAVNCGATTVGCCLGCLCCVLHCCFVQRRLKCGFRSTRSLRTLQDSTWWLYCSNSCFYEFGVMTRFIVIIERELHSLDNFENQLHKSEPEAKPSTVNILNIIFSAPHRPATVCHLE